MKKLKQTLLVSTLVLGSVPYNAVFSSDQASAVELEEQTVEKVDTRQPNSALESNPLVEESVQTESKLPEIAGGVETENISQISEERTKESIDNSTNEVQQITPRKTRDFLLTVDGFEEAPLQEKYKRTNVKTFTFTRSDEFNQKYVYIISREVDGEDVRLTDEINGNVVDLSSYTEEGIYLVDLTGYTAKDRQDSGEFYNNVQRTASSVNIDGVVNNPNEIVKDPTSIVVGRDEMDIYGEYTHNWVISGTDLAGNSIEITGTDRQPTSEELTSLPPGTYIITNKVDETVPEGFTPVEITDTTSGAFKMSGGSVVVEHILLDKEANETVYKTEEPKYGRLDVDYTTNSIDIKGYKLVEDMKPANQKGKYTESEQIVKYYYEKIQTNIHVKYVDENGVDLLIKDPLTGDYDDPYQTTKEDIHGYELVANPENATGTFTDQDQTVTYVYKKKATQVNVHYVDKEGKPLSDDTSIPGVFDDDYTTTPKDIPGYIVKVVPNNSTGKHTVEPTEVTYVYEKIKTTIDVDYVNEEGNPIAKSEKILGEYEDPYQTKSKDIHGYELVAVPDNAIGNHTDQDQTVKYVYKKKETKVNVHFVDEQGQSLAADIVKDGLFDDPYSTEPASIPGYILVEVPSNATGKHTVDPTEVTYIYKKIEVPTVNDTLEGSKIVTGKGMPDSQVIVTFPDGSTVTVNVDKDGNWQAAVPEDVVLKNGERITAVTLDPKTGITSDFGVGKVLPLVTKLPDTGTPESTEKIVDPTNLANTKTAAKITSSDPLTRSASTTKSTSGKQLPNTGEEVGSYAVNLGLFALILAFFGKMLKKKETE